MSGHPFRLPESYEAEDATRNMLKGFLEDRGFVVERDLRERQGQTLVGVSPEGQLCTMRVRLCWRRVSGSRDSERMRTYSAAQLMAKIEDGDWIGSLGKKMARERGRGTSHLLFVQGDDGKIKYAALVPLAEVVPIWIEQREISRRLIADGRLGKRKKNHAENGTSPTIWLQDDRGGQDVAAALWNHEGVRDLARMPRTDSAPPLPEEIDEPSRYTEGACRRISVNAYERDDKARRACIAHHGAKCGICDFRFAAVYGPKVEGLIHVHHLTPLATVGGEYQVHPINDLIPVCPNCHAVIHHGSDCRTVAQVRQMIEEARAAQAPA